jgi:hypothetical protein
MNGRGDGDWNRQERHEAEDAAQNTEQPPLARLEA